MWREDVKVLGRPIAIHNLLLGATALSMVATLYLVFIWVPSDLKQGIVQRIFYFQSRRGALQGGDDHGDDEVLEEARSSISRSPGPS